MERERIYLVKEEVANSLPQLLKVYRVEGDFWEHRFSRKFSLYKLKSKRKLKNGYVKVVYELVKE